MPATTSIRENDWKRMWQFSIRSLLAVTFLVGLGCVIAPYAPSELAGILIIGFLSYTGFSAHREERMNEFGLAFTALLLLMLLPAFRLLQAS